MTDAAVIAAARAIERTTAFRKRFHDGPDPPGANVHDAAVEFARAALEAAQHPAEGVWDAARDRITETNEARRDQARRDAMLAEQEANVVGAGPYTTGIRGVEREVTLHAFADLLRSQFDDQEGTTGAATA